MSEVTDIISSYGDAPPPKTYPPQISAMYSGRTTPAASLYAGGPGAQSPAYVPMNKKKFKSYRLRGEYEKPWLTDPRMKATKYNNWIVMGWVVLGLLLSAAICVINVRKYQIGPMCLVFEDNFETLDDKVWTRLVTLDGFGTGSFDWTTTDSKNAYVDGAGLHIVPTLTNETTTITNDQLYSGYTLNLTEDGSCTDTKESACSVAADPKKGSMIPPVRSARLVTKGVKAIKYGRVEVVAKMPRGDWLWPAIWMMPEDSTYGVWPRSGEIDIMEARGNDWSYPAGGRNLYYGSLHWGPSSATDAYWRTTAARALRRGDFSDSFHTFGMEWDASYIYFYLDNRLTQILFVGFDAKDDLWTKGQFSKMEENATLFTNPWAGSASTTGNAPFDQPFHLILNVAVGSKIGWFPDNIGGKPWLDSSTNAQWTWWSAAEQWLPTWGEGDSRGMTVRSVKMWTRGECGSAEL